MSILRILVFPLQAMISTETFTLNKQLARNKREASLPRMFLHASKVVVEHPLSGERMEIKLLLADDLQAFLDGLIEHKQAPRVIEYDWLIHACGNFLRLKHGV